MSTGEHKAISELLKQRAKYWGRISDLEKKLDEANARVEHYRRACIKISHDVEQTLGKALGYPPLYPIVSTVDDGTVCVGEHVPETLAKEMVARYEALVAKTEK